MEPFTDDSSRALGLDHRANLHSPAVDRRVKKQMAEKEAYLRDLGIKNETTLLAVIPDNAGAHDLLAQYLAAGWEWQAALDDIEAGGTAPEPMQTEADIEREDTGDGTYLGASVDALMKAPVSKPKGGGSKSRSRRSGVSTDPLNVQQSILRRMAA